MTPQRKVRVAFDRLRSAIDRCREGKISRRQLVDVLHAYECTGDHNHDGRSRLSAAPEPPYPWCKGNPTVADCIRDGYCKCNPSCGD